MRPRMYGSSDSQMVRTSASPGSSGGSAVSSRRKSSGAGAPFGRRTSRMRRVVLGHVRHRCLPVLIDCFVPLPHALGSAHLGAPLHWEAASWSRRGVGSVPTTRSRLDHVRQAGASGIVTALHHRQDGTVWPDDEIQERRREIEAAGLVWSVVESIPVPDAIKLGGSGANAAIARFADSLRAVGRAGIRTVCYNFMPVVDWTRTDLMWRLPEHRLRVALRRGGLRRLRRLHPAPPRRRGRPSPRGAGARPRPGRRHGRGRARHAGAYDHRRTAGRRR